MNKMLLTAVLLMPSLAQAASKESLKVLFTKMQGEWQCEGAFASGKALSSNIKFKTDFSGDVMEYRHQDLAPNNFKAAGLWSYSQADKNFVATMHFASAEGSTITAFVSDYWDENHITFKGKELWKPLWAENRFTWKVLSHKEITMVWEVYKNDTWKMGDYLNCRK